jgi:hypothetical protein
LSDAVEDNTRCIYSDTNIVEPFGRHNVIEDFHAPGVRVEDLMKIQWVSDDLIAV